LKLLKLGLVIVMLGAMGCATMTAEPSDYFAKKGKQNAVVSLWMPVWTQRAHTAYNHTLNGFPRTHSDCAPTCPKVDIWQYQYRPHGRDTFTSQRPISTLKEHWKVNSEARVIAISLFNGVKLYADSLLDYSTSFSHIKKVNKVSDPLWGFETFTVRVYVGKRNPAALSKLGQLKDETPDHIIETFLQRGFEVAFVDNWLSQTGKDGTFWRFMVAAEEMPQGQSIRYLSRDADAVLSAGEAFSVGEWIASELNFHRMHILPICLGPMTASVWGGRHSGKGLFSDMKMMIEYFPYRLQYGDDELFTRDMIWPRIKNDGSVMTHHYPRGLLFRAANPYRGSCEEPTQLFCDHTRAGGSCPDVLMPSDIQSPLKALGLRGRYSDLKMDPALFDLHAETERGARAVKALSAN
jgi:hypothetical protein